MFAGLVVVERGGDNDISCLLQYLRRHVGFDTARWILYHEQCALPWFFIQCLRGLSWSPKISKQTSGMQGGE